jgi:uncharacterized membrane protein YedE/YeeE
MEELPVGTLVSILGLGLGLILGFTVQRTNFCTMGALSDVVFMGDWNRMRSWLLAIAVAILGSQALQASGAVDLTEAIYLSPNLGWAGAIIGGLIFGFGMTLCGGCGTKTLVRFGAGNLKSVVVALFLGIFAYMTLRGLLGLARVQLESLTMIDLEARGMATQAIPDALTALGLPAQAALPLTIAVIAGGMLWFCFKCPAFRESRRDIAAGLIVGALIPAAWYVTGVIGYDDFDPVPLASLTFVSPVGESLQYLMTFTGATINFGISVVGGVILGSFIAAMTVGEFRLEAFSDKDDMARHMVGGALMGTGGIMALGCTIGQGISGMSTLALGSLIALLSIIGGAVLGFRYLEEGSLAAIFSARSSDS